MTKIVRFWELEKDDFIAALNSDEDVIFVVLTDASVLSDVKNLQGVRITIVPVDRELSNASDAALKKAVEAKIASSEFMREAREQMLEKHNG